MLNPVQYPLAAMVVNRLGYALLLLLSLAVSMTYFPLMAGGQVAGLVLAGLWHKLIAALFVLLLLFSLVGEKPEIIAFFRTIGILFALLLLEWLVLGVFFPVKDFGAEVRMMLIPLCAVWVGWRMSMDECRLKTLAVIFTVGVVMVGLSVVFMQGSGFSITEEYFADQKNSLGPMLATAAVLCMGLILGSKERKNIPLIFGGLVLVGLCVLLILTIRARAALLAVAVVLSLMLFQRFKSRYTLLSVWMAILLVVAVFILLPHSMKQYVNQSLFSGFSGGDITSGRMGRNYQAMGVWALNPLLGHLVNPTTVEVVHNYPLWSLYQYGLLGAFPFLAVYLYIFCVSLKRIWKIGVDTVMNTGCYMLMALFVVSLFEYTLPFGPGTSTVMSFVFFGMALKVPLKGESFIMEK